MHNYVFRTITSAFNEEMSWYPIISLTGPRQSGKSTLCKKIFSDYEYLNLENPQLRRHAIEDPISFIHNRPSRLIIDEAQYAPDLFSVLQEVTDLSNTPGQYILSGSHNFLLLKNIQQSLAGRVGILRLLPFSYQEILAASLLQNLSSAILLGGYPRIYEAKIPARKYFRDYVQTYIERDVVDLLDVRNSSDFRRFLVLCAQNTGSLVNYSSLAKSLEVSVQTIKSWMTILESSYIVFRLFPFHVNIKKRLTKTPKLYFFDTGLLCYLLNLNTENQLLNSSSYGSIFENYIVSETYKKYLNVGEFPELYFYRDDSKVEIDLVDHTGRNTPLLIEIKSSRMYHDRYSKQLTTVGESLDIPVENRLVIANVDSSYTTKTCGVVSAHDYLIHHIPEH